MAFVNHVGLCVPHFGPGNMCVSEPDLTPADSHWGGFGRLATGSCQGNPAEGCAASLFTCELQRFSHRRMRASYSYELTTSGILLQMDCGEIGVWVWCLGQSGAVPDPQAQTEKADRWPSEDETVKKMVATSRQRFAGRRRTSYSVFSALKLRRARTCANFRTREHLHRLEAPQG